MWDSSEQARNVRFERSGDAYAIFVDGGGYLRRWSRDYGINLVWSQTPIYEWTVRSFGQISGGVGLFNEAQQDYVVYCLRTYGLNIGWSKDRDSAAECKVWWDRLLKFIAESYESDQRQPTGDGILERLRSGRFKSFKVEETVK